MSRLGTAGILCGAVAIASAAVWAATVGSTLSLVTFLTAVAFGSLAFLLGYISWQWAGLDPESRSWWPAAAALTLAVGALAVALGRLFTLHWD